MTSPVPLPPMDRVAELAVGCLLAILLHTAPIPIPRLRVRFLRSDTYFGLWTGTELNCFTFTQLSPCLFLELSEATVSYGSGEDGG